MNSAFNVKHVLAAGLMVAFGASAMAQGNTMPPATDTPAASARQGESRFDPAQMRERMARRQADLKQKLQITAAQEPAWTSFTQSMKPAAGYARPDRAVLEKLSTPDRIDQKRTLRSQRNAEMDRRGDAAKAFYATLTPAQQQVFDAETARRGHRHGHGHHGGSHGDHHKS